MQFSKLAALLALFGTVTGKSTPSRLDNRNTTSFTLNFSLLSMKLASESCVDVPNSGIAALKQYIASLDCQKVGATGGTERYNCEITSALTGDIGGYMGGVASACGSAGGRPDGGHIL